MNESFLIAMQNGIWYLINLAQICGINYCPKIQSKERRNFEVNPESTGVVVVTNSQLQHEFGTTLFRYSPNG